MGFSVQPLCSLCSVVDKLRAKIHHRDRENTEVAQRRAPLWLFVQSLSDQAANTNTVHRVITPALIKSYYSTSSSVLLLK